MADNVAVTELKRAITNEEIRDLTSVYNEGGFAAVAKNLKDKQKSWETTPLHIAVTGESGSGKSSFVNVIRSVTAEDQGAAAVGVTETTSVPTGYPHPRHPNVMLWDLPGMGTLNFPADTYLDKMGFDKYEFFIIVSSRRFKENDMTLAKEIKRRGMKFYFLRSQIDTDIYNSHRSHPGRPQDDIIQSIRDEMEGHLKNEGFNDTPIFFVDNYDPLKYDFQTFTEYTAQHMTDLKREAFIFSLDSLSTRMLDEKERVLKSRVLKCALLSASGGAVPIPGVSFVADMAILVAEFTLYQKQFGLDDESLRKLASVVDKEFEMLKSQIKLEIAAGVITNKGVMDSVKGTAAGMAMLAEEVLDFIPSIFTMIAGSALSFGTTYYILSDHLRKMRKEGDHVLAKAFEQ